MKNTIFLSLAFLLVASAMANCKIIFVDADATGSNDGSTWTDAYNYLQDGLAASSSGEEIWVAKGVYKPDEDSAYPAGTGNRRATFQIISGVTIKGGYAGFGEPDPNARDVDLYETILSGDLDGDDGPDFANNDENSYHVVTGSGTDQTAVLDGSTVTGGNADGSGLDPRGGGMYNYSGSPTLANCTFSGNSAERGGGVYNRSGARTMLTNCIFSGNLAMRGGGMYNLNSSPMLTDCIFSGNSTHGYGGGGGMCNRDGGTPRLVNCLFIGNASAKYGGGMWNFYCTPVLTNCTFSGNTAGRYGGGMYNVRWNPTLTNCILWGNSPEQIAEHYAIASVAYSNVQGGWPGIGNINADPHFAFPNDYHLMPDSPCIDAGTNSPIGGLPATDIDGQPRIVGARVDMGADEFPYESATLVGLDITGPEEIPENSSAQYSAIALYEPNYTGDVTNFTIWSLEPQGCGSINEDGVLTTDRIEILETITIYAQYTFRGVTVEAEMTVRISLPVDLEITGLEEVWGTNPAQYEAIVYYDNGQTDTVTDSALWWAEPNTLATIIDGNGVLHTERIDIPQEYIAIYAQYTSTGVTLQTEMTVRVSPPVDLEVTGPQEVRYSCPAQYEAVVYYDNGHENNVTNSAFWWAEPNTFATIEAGLLWTEEIDEPRDIIIYSHYTVTGVTLQAEMAVALTLPQTFYVPSEYETIQAAIDATQCGDTVLVADGTYTGHGNRGIDFLGKAITVRSENGPENCIIDCNGTEAEAHRGFVFYNGENANSILDGFTITNGYTRYDDGGGIYCEGYSSPTITNCIISGNNGGGIYCSYSNPTITGCTINQNGTGYGGGGIFCEASSPTITNCTIRGNKPWCRPPGGGGGILCAGWEGACSPTITNCTITGNWGGIASRWGSSPIINNCTISGNRNEGIFCGRDSSLIINNSILWANTPLQIREDGASINVRYTDVQGGYSGQGNIDADPLLTLDGHLQAGSPCIDVGDPNADFTSQVDIDGEPRIMGTRVDMGADEFLDSDTDSLPDWWESKYFGSTIAAEPNTDSDLDGYTNLTEYLYSSDPTVGATAYYVDANQPDDSGDGLSWETAKSTIQAAINATKNCGDQVIIALGIYTGLGNYGLDPGGRMIVIQSTDPNDPEVVASTIIDPDQQGRGFYFHSSETTRCVVSGLTITNGRAPLEDIEDRLISRGGAILCSASSPTIINCTITGNSGAGSYDDRGGGICCTDNSSPTISNCTITKNTACFGSGIYCDAGSSPIINNCTITGNRGPMCYGICSFGGGIYCRDSNPCITNCTISGNYPGGICCVNSSPAITNCTVSGHVVGHGNSGISCEDNSSPTITNCFISENHHGIYCEHSSLMITGCTITSNWAEWGPGGGIFAQDSNLTITSSTITDNAAEWGGGTCCWGSRATINNCTISRNLAEDGGGIYCTNGSLTVTNCTISDNSGVSDGLVPGSGGGIYCGDSNAVITRCTISGNLGDNGGGISCDECNPTIINCIISGNTGQHLGGGIFFWKSDAEVTNCTISGNFDPRSGGICNFFESRLMITNCIVWDNLPQQIRDVFGTGSVTYSDVEGGWEGQGNIDADPCFVQPGYWNANGVWVNGDYHLLPDSPCIDAGTDANVHTDIEGNIRPFDFPGVDNNDELPEFDMGAYELVPVEAEMKFTPQMLNCNSKGKYVKAHLTLPEGFLPEDVDVNEPAVAEPMNTYSEYIKVLGAGTGHVRLEICFDREAFCAQITETGEVKITVIGSLTISRYFYATDTIKIKP